MKILASRNIIIGCAVIGVLFVALVVLHSSTSSLETMPSAGRIGAPPAATGEVQALDTVLAAYQHNRSAALRRYRTSPFSTTIDTVTPVGKSGWASAVTVGGGRATLYIADSSWKSMAPPIAPGQTRQFTCVDWQSGSGGTVAMYGCGTVSTP